MRQAYEGVEVTGEIDEQGNLKLDRQVTDLTNQGVRVIILATEVEDGFDPLVLRLGALIHL